MGKREIFERLTNAVIDGDEEQAVTSATDAVSWKMDPMEAIDKGLSKGMGIVGGRFATGEVFLPELLMAAEAFKAAMKILDPEIEAQKKEISKLGKVLIGTVRGDVHNIGKNIVATVLETRGYEVVDIGVDNPTLKIIQQAEKSKVDVIALSSLMTTTMPAQREIIETLKEMKLRKKFKVMIGGGPVSQAWADEIGADGYGKTAIDAIEVLKGLIG